MILIKHIISVLVTLLGQVSVVLDSLIANRFMDSRNVDAEGGPFKISSHLWRRCMQILHFQRATELRHRLGTRACMFLYLCMTMPDMMMKVMKLSNDATTQRTVKFSYEGLKLNHTDVACFVRNGQHPPPSDAPIVFCHLQLSILMTFQWLCLLPVNHLFVIADANFLLLSSFWSRTIKTTFTYSPKWLACIPQTFAFLALDWGEISFIDSYL